jgi:hypothetical protein
MLAYVTTGEEEQAIGRARGLRRCPLNPVLIVSINDVVSDTTYDPKNSS